MTPSILRFGCPDGWFCERTLLRLLQENLSDFSAIARDHSAQVISDSAVPKIIP